MELLSFELTQVRQLMSQQLLTQPLERTCSAGVGTITDLGDDGSGAGAIGSKAEPTII